MKFDFKRFSKIVASVYNEGNPYSLEEVLGIFSAYFQRYEQHMGHPHPPIRASQIARIVQDMPWIDAAGKENFAADIDPNCYPIIIEQHFKTKYRRCDYGINHFFSGRIRELRYYETCY